MATKPSGTKKGDLEELGSFLITDSYCGVLIPKAPFHPAGIQQNDEARTVDFSDPFWEDSSR